MVFELDLDALLAAADAGYTEVSKFPPVIRDLALVVDESVPAQALLEAMRGAAPGARAGPVACSTYTAGKG